MAEKDLDIGNYDIYELLNIYQLPYFFTEDDFDQAKSINQMINDNQETLPIETLIFYQKAYTLVDCLRKYRENKKINNDKYTPNILDDIKLMNNITGFQNFTKYDTVSLLSKIITNEVAEEQVVIPVNPSNLLPVQTSHPMNPPQMTQFTNTFQNKVVAGDINSIKRVVQYKNLHLNTCFRDHYYDSNPCAFNYNFPNEIKNIVSLKLVSIEIPNAWYLFSHLKKNNRFKIEMSICGKCFVFNIVVPDGNYDSETLICYLNKTYFCDSGTNTNLKYLKISINEHNFKTMFELVNEPPPKTMYSLHFTEKTTDNMMETFGWILGFRLAKYLKIVDCLQSEGLFDGGGDRYIFFSLNDYQYNKNESNVVYFEGASMDEDILAKIPMLNGKLCLVISDNGTNAYTKLRRYNGPITLSKIHVKVLDKFGDIIDFNNMDFSFTLELEILYERNNIV